MVSETKWVVDFGPRTNLQPPFISMALACQEKKPWDWVPKKIYRRKQREQRGLLSKNEA
jgi:hypothetical protein